MAESVLSNLRVRGTLAVVGAFTAGIVTMTTLTATTGNFTTVESLTLSGATIRTTAGDTIINSSGLTTADTMTGVRLEIRPASGTGVIRVRSDAGGNGTGSFLCIETLAGVMNQCYASGGRLDCDAETNSRCSRISN